MSIKCQVMWMDGRLEPKFSYDISSLDQLLTAISAIPADFNDLGL